MKKIFLLMVICISLSSYGQKGVPFVIAGASTFYTGGDVGTFLEVGRCGIESPLSYTATIAGDPHINDWYVGGKIYFSPYAKDKWLLSVYSNPQWALNRRLFVMENGVGVIYCICKHFSSGYFFGVQNSKEVHSAPLQSLGVAYLFTK